MSATLPTPQHHSVVTTSLVVVSVVFPILSLISIALRLMARAKARQPIGADDIWIIASWFLTLALSILVWYYAAKIGINFYKTDFLTGTEGSLELIFISSCYVHFPLAAVKIGVLLFYKRIFSTKGFKIAVWIVTTLISIWAFLLFFLILLEIDPVAFPLNTVKLRFDTGALGLAQVSSSFVLDLIVLSLPVPVIKSLHMQRGRKIALILIFWLGAFCTISAIVRTVLLHHAIKAMVSSYERVAYQSKQYIFMVLEPYLSIVAACLPTYGPLSSIRSPELIRSVFSLVSLRSTSSGGAQNTPTPAGTKDSSLPDGTRSSRSYSSTDLNAVSNLSSSKPELQQVYISHGTGQPIPTAREHHRAFSVTNALTVESERRDYP